MTDAGSDPLSPLAHQLIGAGAYDLLVAPSRAPAEAHRLLAGVSPDQLLAVPVASPAAAHALLAALWLRHDGLHECHDIVQKSPDDPRLSAPFPHQTPHNLGRLVQNVPTVEIAKPRNHPSLRDLTSTFSFWHAIMHRREGDFSNAKYWYARCAGHPAHARVGQLAAWALGRPEFAKYAAGLTRGGAWDPNALVDLTETADQRGSDDPARRLAVDLQRLEWQALFDETVRQATGG